MSLFTIHVDKVVIQYEDGTLEEIKSLLTTIHKNQTKIMSKLSEIQTAFNEMKVAVAEERVQIKDRLDTLTSKITDLETNIADGGTAVEREQLLADIKSETQAIKDIIPDTPPTDPPIVDDSDDASVDHNA